MNTTTFISTAQRYKKLGFSVIPLINRSKNPAIKWAEFQKRQPSDDEVKRWALSLLSPNIGIPTGEISRIVVVDVEHGGKIDDLPATVSVKTGGGGYHFYYKYPGFSIKNATRVRELTDIRADGGYVVAPPSIHESGNQYEWINSPEAIAISDLPKWIIESQTNHSSNLFQPVTKGHRNNQTFKRALKLKSEGVSISEAIRICLEIPDLPPQDAQDIERTVVSAYQDKYVIKTSKQETEDVTYTSFISDKSSIFEEILTSDNHVSFIQSDGVNFSEVQLAVVNGRFYKPSDSDIVKDRTIAFPSQVTKYKNQTELFNEIRAFIHAYVDIQEIYECWSAYYVLFSWLFDRMPVCPYLCALGSSSTGKTRLIQTVGSICYKPFMASGSISASSVFRILDEFRGTLVVNEFDHIGQFDSEIIVVFNNGFDKGFPTVRVEGDKNKFVKKYEVFGPKLFSSRKRKNDWAFESRLITIPMKETKRQDIPTFLLDDFHQKAQDLRNKLLWFRLSHYFKPIKFHHELFTNISGRLRQTLLSLTSVVHDEAFLEQAVSFSKELEKELKSTRQLDLETITYQVLQDYWNLHESRPFIKDVTSKVKELSDIDNLTPKTIGKIVRDELGFTTKRVGVGYQINLDQITLSSLSERYEISEDKAPDEHGEVSEQLSETEVLAIFNDKKEGDRN